MTTKSLSVIMPARNASAFIDEALLSIRQQVSVDPAAIEILVIDDGSNDDTATRARAHPHVRVLKGPVKGIAAARNLGLRRASAPLITFLDADDRWPLRRLKHQLGVLADAPKLDFVLGRTRQFTEFEGAGQGTLPSWAPAGTRHCLLLAAACFRRRLFEKLGGFDETLQHCEDVDLFLRAFDAGLPHIRLDEVHLERRVHRNNHSHAQAGRERGLLHALARSIHRQGMCSQ